MDVEMQKEQAHPQDTKTYLGNSFPCATYFENVPVQPQNDRQKRTKDLRNVSYSQMACPKGWTMAQASPLTFLCPKGEVC